VTGHLYWREPVLPIWKLCVRVGSLQHAGKEEKLNVERCARPVRKEEEKGGQKQKVRGFHKHYVRRSINYQKSPLTRMFIL